MYIIKPRHKYNVWLTGAWGRTALVMIPTHGVTTHGVLPHTPVNHAGFSSDPFCTSK